MGSVAANAGSSKHSSSVHGDRASSREMTKKLGKVNKEDMKEKRKKQQEDLLGIGSQFNPYRSVTNIAPGYFDRYDECGLTVSNAVVDNVPYRAPPIS